MRTINIKNQKITLELSKDELGMLSNSLNEVCNGLKVKEFDCTIGASIEEVSNILKFLISIYIESDKKNMDRFT